MGEERLTEIPTSWTTISSAHTPGPKSHAAMEDLVGRYHDAVTRYIHLKVRDKHLADDGLQEFWTKVVTGKLAGADKSLGRFRGYLRTVHHRLSQIYRAAQPGVTGNHSPHQHRRHRGGNLRSGPRSPLPPLFLRRRRLRGEPGNAFLGWVERNSVQRNPPGDRALPWWVAHAQ